jgi:hypothetical protein
MCLEVFSQLGQSRARADLRRTLSVPNRTLGEEWLTTDREMAGLNPDAEVWLDLNEFHGLLAACETHPHPPTEDCPDCLPLLVEAGALYRDHFLAGFTLYQCRPHCAIMTYDTGMKCYARKRVNHAGAQPASRSEKRR